MWSRFLCVVCLSLPCGFAQDQSPPTEYDQPVITEGDQTLVTDTLFAAEETVFALLPSLANGALVGVLQQLAPTRTVYLVIPETQRGNLARSLVAAGVQVKTIPQAPAEGLVIIDYRVTIDGPLLDGQGAARVTDYRSDHLYLVYQASFAWQGATPY